MPGINVLKLREKKRKGEPIVCVTAYDVLSASLAEECGVDVLLVGDSMANTVYGHTTTLPLSLETTLRHTEAVVRAAPSSFIVADLPFGSYQVSTSDAVKSSVELMKAGAHAVKLEGVYEEATVAILKAGIPVMGHVGFTPQFVHALGGFRVQGRDGQAERVTADAQAVEALGVFAIVLELVPASLAEKLTALVDCPTIGIGAGPSCDGQIQVIHDILGLSSAEFKHSKRFVDGRNLLRQGLSDYVSEVRSRTFPTVDNSF